jgi:hypothetical protein
MTEPSRHVRDLEFSARGNHGVSGVAFEPVFRSLFAVLAPGRTLPEQPRAEATRRYNWGTDQSYFTAEGDGLSIAEECFGAVPGDGIDVVYHLTVGSEILIYASQGRDYLQTACVFRITATAETIDVATDALLQVATAAGFVLEHRDDAPGPVPWPRSK